MIEKYSRKYDLLVNNGIEEDYIINHKTYLKRKNAKKSTSLNLLTRLKLYKSRILGFMYYFDIPFSNNQAERDKGRLAKLEKKLKSK